jgi:hypothetical protein
VDPGADAMTVTARADVVKMPPGHYDKIAQVLRVQSWQLGFKRSYPRMRKVRVYHRHLGKDCLDIQSLPDDASELIRDGMNAYRVPE